MAKIKFYKNKKSSQVESSRVGSDRVGSSRVESSRVESNRIELTCILWYIYTSTYNTRRLGVFFSKFLGITEILFLEKELKTIGHTVIVDKSTLQ